jgi:hypothetical protein
MAEGETIKIARTSAGKAVLGLVGPIGRTHNPAVQLKKALEDDLFIATSAKGRVRMNDVIGIAWFKDEATYRRALAIFTDSENMPASFEDWKALVGKQCDLIKGSGNIAIRADIDPETFTDWCVSRGFVANSQGRIAFVNHVVLEYQKIGKGTVIE